jgi:hypothetical protein
LSNRPTLLLRESEVLPVRSFKWLRAQLYSVEPVLSLDFLKRAEPPNSALSALPQVGLLRPSLVSSPASSPQLYSAVEHKPELPSALSKLSSPAMFPSV